MQIHGTNGTNQVHGAQGLSGPHFRGAKAEPSPSAQPADRVEISSAAQEAARLAEAAETRAAEQVAGPDGVRTALVERLRAEIASGSYESGDKLETAVDRLLDEIG